MGTKRKTWYLRKKDILYVEENHDGRYGAPGEKRKPKRKPTPEDIQRVNAWKKEKGARLLLMEYFSPGDLWATYTYPARDQTAGHGNSNETVSPGNGQAEENIQEKRTDALLDPEH